MSSFFLVMAQYPHVQRKAQAGIDCVVGPDRLPSFQDRENLPYIYAMVKEILRWHPVLPMGTAHASVMDDTYEGYTFPKGTLMVPNVWCVSSWLCHQRYEHRLSWVVQSLGDNSCFT